MQTTAGDDTEDDDGSEHELQEGAECLGLDLQELQAAEEVAAAQGELAAQGPEDVCWVLPENWTALQLFLACQHQIELVIGMGGGSWSAVRSVNLERELAWLEIDPPEHAQVVRRYRVIESELLRLMNQRLREER